MKILIPWHSIPTTNSSYFTSIVNSIVNELRKSSDIEVFWLISMPTRFETMSKTLFGTILDIHNFQNALEVMEKIKPDIVLASASPNLIDYACSLAGKFKKIPVISGFYNSFTDEPLGLQTHTKLFFSNHVPTDLNKTQKKPMKRGRFFLYKLWFVVKTQLSIKMNLNKIIKIFILILKYNLRYEPQIVDSRFANDLHWVTGEDLASTLIKNGFDKSSIIISGDPMLDELYKKFKSYSTQYNPEKIKILFAPSTAYEHGLCTKFEQFRTIKNILNAFLSDNTFEIIVKIHPSSASFTEYEDFIKKINYKIQVFQKEDIFDLMNNCDLVITFPLTTVNTISLLFNKPVIVYNFLNVKDDKFIKEKIGYECKDISKLINLAKEILTQKSNQRNQERFIQKYYYKIDGRSSERICNFILKKLNS